MHITLGGYGFYHVSLAAPCNRVTLHAVYEQNGNQGMFQYR